ncbi:lycopene cyclase domain-containing protein [Natrialba swarupiae]|uniref:Lycopene cyclase domain-containing protein n=1 Tax=Natrialba swarupiae TaxID=2448032 RepID=A0A5D5ALX2_9EURY|nr:lycopene cyclase domain-containing protein [Natrialba swarupiae]TYT61867.1 lycopene cyclase domain-containing protein [Natrialba swarupiae]
MTLALSYLSIHAIFVLPPIVVLGWFASRRDHARWSTRALTGLGVILVLAVVYTTPWDNLLIAEGVWWYGTGSVRATIWHAPVEEYLFFVFQPLLTGFWLFQFLRVPDRSLRIPRLHRLVGALAGLSIGGLGWLLLGSTPTTYLGAILLWAGPILAIQWAFGITALWDVRRTVALAVAVPTLYLWIVDRIAIGLGVWVISEEHTIGVSLIGLPVEEALFFLVTNVFVVQGLVLYVWTLEQLDETPTLQGLRTRR